MTCLRAFSALLLLALAAQGATYYVTTGGSDTTGDGSAATPWRTIQKGVDATVAGDTVVVGDGDYGEYVTTHAHGAEGSRITVQATNQFGAVTKQFRIIHRYHTITGIRFEKAMDTAADQNQGHVRIEAAGHQTIVSNCFVGPGVHVISTNFLFKTNAAGMGYMEAADVDFTAAGFQSGRLVMLGACGWDSLWYTNHDKVITVESNTTTRIYSTNLVYDAGSNYWAAAFACGSTTSGNDGYAGIISVVGSGVECATNCVITGNTISNLIGAGMRLQGDGFQVRSNTVTEMRALYGLVMNTRNSTAWRNLFLNCSNILWYTSYEISVIDHPAGADWYDFQVGGFPAHYNVHVSTNNTFVENWVQGVENQLCMVQREGYTNNGFLFASNVFVGVGAQGSISVDDCTFHHNTLLRVSYDPDRTMAIAFGGSLDHFATNLIVQSNAFVNIGDHSNLAQEGGFSAQYSQDPILSNNFACGAETMNWSAVVQGATNFTGANGGDPLFVNINDPLGPDGLPFTDDDGLRPLPNSKLATLGYGALAPLTNQTVAHFSQVTSTNWQDPAGTNYSPAWVALTPYGRNGPVRLWDEPEALGHVPAVVTFTATNSLSGISGVTNCNGLRYFRWEFSDGQTVVNVRPQITHTFLTAGEHTVTLWVTNLYGASAGYSNTYRVLDKTNATTVWYVSKAGSDLNGGQSWADSFLTIDHALGAMAAGDFVAVSNGVFDEVLDVDRNIATVDSRGTFVGYGAEMQGVNLRYPNWTFEGFTFNGTNTWTANGVVYMYEAADNTWVRNCWFKDCLMDGNDDHMVYCTIPAGVLPTDGQMNGRFFDNLMTGGRGICFQLHGANHQVAGNLVYNMIGESDFARPWGSNHWFYDNVAKANAAVTGDGHPDCAQFFGDTGHWCRDIVFERNSFLAGWVEEQTNWAICQFEMHSGGAFEGDWWITNRFKYTNIVFQNNLFANFGVGGSVDTDGTKWYNNTFYRCATNQANAQVLVWGGPKGSAYGTELTNNIFAECGGQGTSTNGGWYASDAVETNVSITADYNYVVGANGWPKEAGTTGVKWGSYGEEASGVNGGAPLFASADYNDFRVATNSPATGVGADMSGMFTTDIYGDTRASWDIGAFAVTSGGTNEPAPPAAPVAAFTGSPLSGLAPLIVTFSNTSTGATNYSWAFGDTETGTFTNGTHTYAAAGTYTVALTAVGEGGTNTQTRAGYVTATNAPASTVEIRAPVHL